MPSSNTMNPNATIAQLYSLLVNADGRIDQKEMQMGEKLVVIEQLNPELFHKELERLKSSDNTELFDSCANALKKLEKKVQVRYIAWMCVIANADWFMAKQEWSLIYKLYSKELNLSLDHVMAEQKLITHQIADVVKGVA